MMQKHLEQRQHEQQLIEKYIHSNQIIVKDLPMVETHVRKILLSWLGKAMAKKNRVIKTEFGTQVRVDVGSNRVILQSEDGILEMPEVTFQFLEGA